MADEYDRFIMRQYYDTLWNIKLYSEKRSIREYDFFSEASTEKLKQVHVLAWPENPDALQEFFLPQLISPANKWMKTPVGKVESGIVIKNEEPLIPAAPTAGAFLFGKRLDDSPATETDQKPRPSDLKGKGKMVESGIVIKNEATAEPDFLFNKRLEDSDLNPGLDRLLISKCDKLMGLLSEGERIKVEGGGGVTVILELKGGDQELVLAKMVGTKDDVLLVKHDWFTIFSAHNLKVGDVLMGWGTRRRRHDVDGAKFRLRIYSLPPRDSTNINILNFQSPVRI